MRAAHKGAVSGVWKRKSRISPELTAKVLDRPKIAGAVVVLDRHRERVTGGAAPPLRRIERPLALQRSASPTPKLRFPLDSAQETASDHRSHGKCDILLAGRKMVRAGVNDPIILKRRSHIVKRFSRHGHP